MLRFIVPAMKCGGCAAKIQQALQNLPGVAELRTDPANRLVTVDGPADPAAVRDALVQAGYGAGLEDARP